MATMNIPTTTIPKFIFDSKAYDICIIDRITEKFYQSPIDNDDFTLSYKARSTYVKIANMKLWKGFDIEKFIIIVKSNSGDPCLLVTKRDNSISIDFGHAYNGKVLFSENYVYSENDTFGQDNTLRIFNTDDHRNNCLKWALLVMNLFVYCNDFFDKKEIMIGGKKKKYSTSYIFNIGKFESKFIGVNSYDSIITDHYQRFDPSHKIKNIFPFDKVISKISLDTLSYDMVISFDKINNSKIILKVYSTNRVNLYKGENSSWGFCRFCEIEYNPNKNSFETGNFGIDVDSSDFTDDEMQLYADDVLEAIDALFDIFKYMVFNTKKVENNKLYINESSIKVINKERGNIYRNSANMCSIVYEIDGKKVHQVDESLIDDMHKQVKPCEYAFSVRGHYRHLKSGKVVWVNPYIKNKDKEFKPKNYSNKKEG